MPSFLHVLCCCLLLPCAVFSVFLDEAYTVDFHYALLGAPIHANTFFHQPVHSSKASLLYTLSDRAVLAALNPKNGAVVWRQPLYTANSTSAPRFLRVGQDQSLVFTSVASRVTAWSATDGRLLWDNDYAPLRVTALATHHPSDASSPAADSDALFLALSGPSQAVVKLTASTGHLQWTCHDQSGDSSYAILTSPGLVHHVSLHSTFLKAFKLKVTSLDAKDGLVKHQHTLNTDSDIKSPDNIIFASSNARLPILAWSDNAKKTIKIYSAGAANFQSFDISKSGNAKINDINVHVAPAQDSSSASSAKFLVSYSTDTAHWADVFDADTSSPDVRKAFSLAPVSQAAIFSVAVFDQSLHFVRISQDHTTLFSSTSEIPLATWPTTFQIPGLVGTAAPLHAVTEIAARSSSNYAVRAAVLVSTGDWVLVRNGETSWSRPESLSTISRAEFAVLAETESLADDLKLELSKSIMSSFSHRVARHFQAAQTFPLLVKNLRTTLANKFLNSNSASESDAFGFHKLLVARTDNQRLIALDMGDRGRVVWNIDAAGQGGRCIPENNAQPIELHLRCLGQLSPSADALSIWPKLQQYRKPFLKFGQPSLSTESDQDLNAGRESTSFSFQAGQLAGYRNRRGPEIWRFLPPSGHRIHSVKAQNSFEPVASIGKVLADRRVLYKYLNPNTALVITADDEKRQVDAVLLDTVSGRVLYSSRHENIDTSRPISSAVFENRVAFSYTMDSPQNSVSKGYQLVVAEFYESSIPNDRGAMSAFSNYSGFQGRAANSHPYAISQAFHVPEEISQMTVTQTGQGITSRQLLVGLESTSSIVGIPPYVIDPRRTVGKDPTAPEQYEEGLSRYTPMIDFDAKWYLNHKEEIFAVQNIMTTASLLESTSLVLAYGLDVFGTRVSPSFAFDILGTEFNKIQLLLTVLGLLAGVFVVAPMIERKQTNTLWQAA